MPFNVGSASSNPFQSLRDEPSRSEAPAPTGKGKGKEATGDQGTGLSPRVASSAVHQTPPRAQLPHLSASGAMMEVGAKVRTPGGPPSLRPEPRPAQVDPASMPRMAALSKAGDHMLASLPLPSLEIASYMPDLQAMGPLMHWQQIGEAFDAGLAPHQTHMALQERFLPGLEQWAQDVGSRKTGLVAGSKMMGEAVAEWPAAVRDAVVPSLVQWSFEGRTALKPTYMIDAILSVDDSMDPASAVTVDRWSSARVRLEPAVPHPGLAQAGQGIPADRRKEDQGVLIRSNAPDAEALGRRFLEEASARPPLFKSVALQGAAVLLDVLPKSQRTALFDEITAQAGTLDGVLGDQVRQRLQEKLHALPEPEQGPRAAAAGERA